MTDRPEGTATPEIRAAWLRGYATALATAARQVIQIDDGLILYALHADRITLEEFEAAGCSPFDLDTIRIALARRNA